MLSVKLFLFISIYPVARKTFFTKNSLMKTTIRPFAFIMAFLLSASFFSAADAQTTRKRPDKMEDRADRKEDKLDRKENRRDRREDVLDRQEDRKDHREDIRDRREDVRDAKHEGGKWD
jgi:hypothetical protein